MTMTWDWLRHRLVLDKISSIIVVPNGYNTTYLSNNIQLILKCTVYITNVKATTQLMLMIWIIAWHNVTGSQRPYGGLYLRIRIYFIAVHSLHVFAYIIAIIVFAYIIGIYTLKNQLEVQHLCLHYAVSKKIKSILFTTSIPYKPNSTVLFSHFKVGYLKH